MLLPKPWSLGSLVILILGLHPHTGVAITDAMADDSFRGFHSSFCHPSHDKRLSGREDMPGHFLLNVCHGALKSQPFVQYDAESFGGFLEDGIFHQTPIFFA